VPFCVFGYLKPMTKKIKLINQPYAIMAEYEVRSTLLSLNVPNTEIQMEKKLLEVVAQQLDCMQKQVQFVTA